MARAATDELIDPSRLTDRLRGTRVQQQIGAWTLWLLIAGFIAWAAVTQTAQFVVGLIVGSLYALSAVGLTLIYGVARVSHFAHGDAMMMAAYLAFLVLTGAVAGARAGDVEFPLHVSALPASMEPIWRNRTDLRPPAPRHSRGRSFDVVARPSSASRPPPMLL